MSEEIVNLQSWIEEITNTANDLKSESLQIIVTSEDQKAEMKQAREMRLTVKNLRVSVEKRRKELKDFYLKTGRKIDEAANYIKELLEPIECHLQLQEDFAKIAKERRDSELRAKRMQELAELEGNSAMLADLASFSDEDWAVIIETFRAAKVAREKAAKAEAARIEAEKKDREDEERRQAELAEARRLAEEARIAREAAEAEKNKAEAEARKAEESARAARIEAERIRAEQERKEREERERIEAQEKARIEAEERAKSASDREKLIAFASKMRSIKCPELSELRQIESNINLLIEKIARYCEESAN